MALIQRLSPYDHANCDATLCPATITFGTAGVWGIHEAEAVMAAAGWTIFAGVYTGRRTYCPDHQPRPGHKMRQVL